MTLLVALAATIGAAATWWPVRSIEVTGTQRLDPDKILGASGMTIGHRWWLGPPEPTKVIQIPEVQGATVTRHFPFTWRMNVVEYDPLFRLEGQPSLAASVDGTVIAAPDGNIPELRGWGRGKPARGKTLAKHNLQLLKAWPSFPLSLRTDVVAAIVRPNDVRLESTDGVELRFGTATDLLDKARVADAVLADVRANGEEVAYIDVSAPAAPVSRPVPDETPAPPAATRAPQQTAVGQD